MNEPKNAQVTATKVGLGKGPMDMPDRGGSKPNAQITSSVSPLNRKESPVAQFGAKPSMGQVQTTSEQVPLKRNASSPYDGTSATKPQVPFGGGKGKK